MLEVKKHKLKMIKAIAKEALSEPPVLFDRDRFMLMEPLTHKMCPSESDSQECQKLVKTLVMTQMTRFEVEPTGLQGSKQRFDFPPLGVQGQGMVRFGICSDDQIVVSEPHADEREPMSINPAAFGKHLRLPETQRLKQRFGATGSAFRADACVVFDADVEGQPKSFEVSEPACADELPIGYHCKDMLYPSK